VEGLDRRPCGIAHDLDARSAAIPWGCGTARGDRTAFECESWENREDQVEAPRSTCPKLWTVVTGGKGGSRSSVGVGFGSGREASTGQAQARPSASRIV